MNWNSKTLAESKAQRPGEEKWELIIIFMELGIFLAVLQVFNIYDF